MQDGLKDSGPGTESAAQLFGRLLARGLMRLIEMLVGPDPSQELIEQCFRCDLFLDDNTWICLWCTYSVCEECHELHRCANRDAEAE
jgi:hypothetical protein